MDNSPKKIHSSTKFANSKRRSIPINSLREIKKYIFKEKDQYADMDEGNSEDYGSPDNRGTHANYSNDGSTDISIYKTRKKYPTTSTLIVKEKEVSKIKWSEDDRKTLDLEDIVLLDESTWMEQQISDATKETNITFEETPENSRNNTGSERTPQIHQSPDTNTQKSIQSSWNHGRKHNNSVSWSNSNNNINIKECSDNKKHSKVTLEIDKISCINIQQKYDYQKAENLVISGDLTLLCIQESFGLCK